MSMVQLYFLNLVQQEKLCEKSGESTIIRLPEGGTVLVDCGVPEAGPAIVRRLQSLGVKKLDALLLSHFHLDHIGGAPAVLDAFDVDRVYSYPVDWFSDYMTKALPAYVAALEKHHLVPQPLFDGMSFSLEGVRFDILSPPRDFPHAFSDYQKWMLEKYGQEVYPYDSAAVTVPMANDSSICFKMSYGTSTYLSCGDLYYSGERMVLDRHKDDLHALVAKANHHGNMTSSIPEWVDAVGAKIVVGMKDGLPDDLVKKKDPEKAEFWKNHVSGWPYERWPEHGADYYFTYWNGEVRVEMDDQGHATAYPQRGTKNMRPSSIG